MTIPTAVRTLSAKGAAQYDRSTWSSVTREGAAPLRPTPLYAALSGVDCYGAAARLEIPWLGAFFQMKQFFQMRWHCLFTRGARQQRPTRQKTEFTCGVCYPTSCMQSCIAPMRRPRIHGVCSSSAGCCCELSRLRAITPPTAEWRIVVCDILQRR